VNKEARFKSTVSPQSGFYMKQEVTPRKRSISPVAARTPEKKSQVLTPLKNTTINTSINAARQNKSPRIATPKRAVTPIPKRSRESESKIQQGVGGSSKKSLTPVKNRRY